MSTAETAVLNVVPGKENGWGCRDYRKFKEDNDEEI